VLLNLDLALCRAILGAKAASKNSLELQLLGVLKRVSDYYFCLLDKRKTAYYLLWSRESHGKGARTQPQETLRATR